MYYTTTDGAAKADSDYLPTSGTVNFAAGETKKTIEVAVVDDEMYEAKEAFTVNLSDAVGATIVRGIGTATIGDDDAKPSLSIDNVTVTEDPSGATATFTVSLSAVSGLTTTVRYGTANGTAKAGRDYTKTSGTLTINAGLRENTFTVPVLYNSSLAADADFFAKLSGPKQASLSSLSKGTCTIQVPASAAMLNALAAARTPISRVGAQQIAQAADEVIRSIWLTIYR